MPDTLRSTAREGRGDKTRTTEERTAQIKSFVRGNTCQQLHFNNDDGTFVGGALVPCETEKKGAARSEPEPQAAPKGARLNSIRDSFGR